MSIRPRARARLANGNRNVGNCVIVYEARGARHSSCGQRQSTAGKRAKCTRAPLAARRRRGRARSCCDGGGGDRRAQPLERADVGRQRLAETAAAAAAMMMTTTAADWKTPTRCERAHCDRNDRRKWRARQISPPVACKNKADFESCRAGNVRKTIARVAKAFAHLLAAASMPKAAASFKRQIPKIFCLFSLVAAAAAVCCRSLSRKWREKFASTFCSLNKNADRRLEKDAASPIRLSLARIVGCECGSRR